MQKLSTARFGEIEVKESEIVHFENGIPAFEQEHEFVIIPYEKESPYVFLQSVQTADLAFLMTNPFLFFPEYEFELEDAVQENLGITKQEDLCIYVLLTIPAGKVSEMTANLMAPIVIHVENHKASQIVLERSHYTTKHRLFPEVKEGA